MKNDIVIRIAVDKDIQSIATLYKELLGDDTTSTKNALEEFRRFDASDMIFVADFDGDVVGTIQISVCRSLAFNCRPYIVAEYLIVKREFRSQGIGTRLLQQIDKIAENNNASFACFVSSSFRTDAHYLYKKLGFTDSVVGFRKAYK